MTKYVIQGGNKLNGEITISGAKNAAVGILPAALMVDGVCRIENVPDISDVALLVEIMEDLGAKITKVDKNTLDIDCTGVQDRPVRKDLAEKMRASYYAIGALLGRFHHAVVALPGGCNFGGVRPIDQHIKGFEALGADVDVRGSVVYAEAPELKGTYISFDVVSVGATMNVMLAAAMAAGKTVMENCAREPHIVDLANFLNSMGADIRGAGTDTIKIYGVEKLHGGNYSIIPDQIEAGTYMAAVAAAGGNVLIRNVIPKHMECISVKLYEMGVTIEESDDAIRVISSGRLHGTSVRTLPYPGFPTDMQPQLAAVMVTAKGSSTIREGVWSSRYKYVDEFNRMGARIQVDNNIATIEGVERLHGALIRACDLRAGAAMVIAGLAAEGTTKIENIHYVERGYEDLVAKLTGVGADIRLVDED